MKMFSQSAALASYTVVTWAGDMAPQGCDQSTGLGAGMRGRRQPPPRHSGRKAINPGSARAEPSHPSKLGFLFFCHSAAVFVRQLLGPHLSTWP